MSCEHGTQARVWERTATQCRTLRVIETALLRRAGAGDAASVVGDAGGVENSSAGSGGSEGEELAPRARTRLGDRVLVGAGAGLELAGFGVGTGVGLGAVDGEG
jgi:hypothetical protein